MHSAGTTVGKFDLVVLGATGRVHAGRLIALLYRGLVGRCDEADWAGAYDVTSEGHYADTDGYTCWFKV